MPFTYWQEHQVAHEYHAEMSLGSSAAICLQEVGGWQSGLASCFNRIKVGGAGRILDKGRAGRAGVNLKRSLLDRDWTYPTASTALAQRHRDAEATGAFVQQPSRAIISMSQMEMEGAGEMF